MLPSLILLAIASTHTRADPNPNSPGPGDVLTEGRPCAVSWDVDPTGRWKTMHIDLMTGDNFDMVFLANVGIVDGTIPSKTTYTYSCPQVTPHSPIYFYQFSTPSTSNKTWTGRFTITDPSGKIVSPSRATQPDGQNIPWGMGALINSSRSSFSSGALVSSGTGALDSRPSPIASPFGTSGASDSQPALASSSGGPVMTTHPPTFSSSALSNMTTVSEMPHMSAPTSSDPASTMPSASAISNADENGATSMSSLSSILVQIGLAMLGVAVML